MTAGRAVRMAEQTCLVFKMNGSLYAVDVAYAGSVDHGVKIQRMPGIPSCLLGVTTIRDEIVPVVDLRSHFNQGPLPEGEAFSTIIGNLNGHMIAYQVDEIQSISGLEFGDLSEAPLIIRSTTGCVQKVTMLNNEVVVMVDLMSILSEGEKNAVMSFLEKLKENEEEQN